MTDKIRIALEALKVAYIAMQHMGNVLNNIDAVDEEEDAQHDAAFEAVRAAIAELEQPQETRIVAASMGCYPKADQKFFNFWYGHMFEDRMQPPLVGIDHATARYIWDGAIAALEQPEEAAAMRWTHEQLHAAFETQIKHVSHVHYDSNEICRHFYGEFIRELLTPTTPKD